MDHLRDAKPFAELMEQLCATLRDGYKCTEAMRDAYWKALRDVPFSEVKANVERIIATATRDTPFPRPSALRNSPAQISSSGFVSAAQLKAERASIQNWRELRTSDPIRFEVEWRAARAFTELAACDEDSIEFAEWQKAYRLWEGLRRVPRPEQEAAVKRHLGQS